jgi:hypothetical protein
MTPSSVSLRLASLLLVCALSFVDGRFYYKDFRDVRFLDLAGSAVPNRDSDPPCIALTSAANHTGATWYERSVEMRERRKRKEDQGPDGFSTYTPHAAH